jgi:hypothetical protein
VVDFSEKAKCSYLNVGLTTKLLSAGAVVAALFAIGLFSAIMVAADAGPQNFDYTDFGGR